MPKPTIKRSACDQCRTKRVRCLRAQDSTAPCARCSYTGAQCVTGVPGRPGRPSKQLLAASLPRPHRSSMLRDMHRTQAHEQVTEVVPTPVAMSKTAVHSHQSSNSEVHEPHPDFWVPLSNISAFFDSPSSLMDQSLASGEDVCSPADQLGGPSQLQGLFGANADDDFDALVQFGDDSGTALDMYVNPLSNDGNDLLASIALPQCSSVASSMMKFRDEMDERIATIDEYYSNSSKVLQRCKDESEERDVTNPAALLLTCSKEFTDMIQSLTSEVQLHTHGEDTLSTEILLLALSSYLALMRLFDFLFHRIYKYICQLPPESYQSIKVKSVLRISGFSLLQDMPLKAYATGILDAIQSQVQILERSMGVPAEYSLSAEATTSPTTVAPGIFSSVQRTQLFLVVMAQEDVKSRRGTKSYVESIRASIKETMAFLHD
ncbi:hypothetical protein OPT61_g7204 [Boeremia exigua]|uniref:Uncharacterized protein n=1 Tax=Boeremia exigua TaxID=749465 RepID=A0ACC2I3I6_9PLEO|nr:hypothetical protein OPT61_g7204 [Boeremia exigua]